MLITSTTVFLGRIMDATEKVYVINLYNFTMGGTDRLVIF